MKAGVYVVSRANLSALSRSGVVCATHLGAIDFLRLIAGHGTQPAAGEAIGVHGVDALLAAASPEERASFTATLRGGLVAGKGYFEWKQIPLVFVLEGTLDDTAERGADMASRLGTERVPLASTLGSEYEWAPSRAWLWGAQLG